MARPKVYFPGTLWQFYEFARPILEPGCEIVVEPERVYDADELAAVFASVEGAILTAFEKVPRSVIEAAPALRALSKYGAGIEAIDLDAATERGIPVVNTPGANALGVAEHTVALILSLLRRVTELDRLVRTGRWKEARRIVGGDVEGSVLGIVGLGSVGRLVARRMKALGMRVIAYDPFQDAATFADAGAERVDLDDLLAASDVVSLHMTVTAETRGMIDTRRLDRMKRGALLVNTARAALVDQPALVCALRDGRLGGAALDVMEPEPLPDDSPLLGIGRLIITPHHAGTTVRTRERTLTQAAANLVRMLGGELPEVGLCNPGVREKFASRYARP
ncbi:MAG: hydroxyacid dehydrogenase [Rhodospirillales bacterium]|jgi:phosphoglycerate dehydrogenase-like enzyme|nr:hydroxyacid dehydrogenase [Rhodospirillales bacterium]